jgi:hypothetical protein
MDAASNSPLSQTKKTPKSALVDSVTKLKKNSKRKARSLFPKIRHCVIKWVRPDLQVEVSRALRANSDAVSGREIPQLVAY